MFLAPFYQYNTIQYNTTWNTIQPGIQYNTIQYNREFIVKIHLATAKACFHRRYRKSGSVKARQLIYRYSTNKIN